MNKYEKALKKILIFILLLTTIFILMKMHNETWKDYINWWCKIL